MIISFDKPKRVRSSAEHNAMYSSDTDVAGTYVPNMSQEDKLRWKARYIGGTDPRVEIRKTVEHVQVLLIVRRNTVAMSANGTMKWKNYEWGELIGAILEARDHIAARLKETNGN